MKYYPINLDIKNKKCLVVGGGKIGTRKVLSLLESGGQVTVVSPEITDELKQLYIENKIEWLKRCYLSSDLDGIFLVIGASNHENLNKEISFAAKSKNILCNIVDKPDECNFILPAIVKRGDLVIAVSTSGKSPAFAKYLRRELEKQFDDSYNVFLNLMGEIRSKILNESNNSEHNKNIFENLIKEGLLELIKKRDINEINKLLFKILGQNYKFESL
ncbi:MAG: bifunctional precorrin-2 dehydrogenase/sirohydrochlorin ferrochelatase [Desulfobacterales bacterium]|nr:bifunctional precorrin-2 dehydrogenase/sirohydrochlorin ferrochelatase [Desulfobacterales bacterium]MBF0395291.1 bifunctional precorrin-2 dehydrogenase/sirohydrochlorin ferrochelatase [Desulfobacterales bacterium]